MKQQDQLKIIIEQAKEGRIIYEDAFKQMIKIFDKIGCFTVDDIELVYMMGRKVGKKKKAFTESRLVKHFLKANKLFFHLKWE